MLRTFRIGTLFIFLDPGEAIPRFTDQEFYSGYTYLIRPAKNGFEILRHEPKRGWYQKPEQLFDTAEAALSYGYEEHSRELEEVNARMERPKYSPDWRGMKNCFEIK